MLLEIPSLSWSETNQKYAQKTVQLAQETMKLLQLPKKRSKRCEMRTKVDTSCFNRVSQEEEKLGIKALVS